MKPSSPEMWTSLDYELKQVIFTCSSKQFKKKKKKWNVCLIWSCQDIARTRFLTSPLEAFACIASMLLTQKGHALVFYLWPWQLPKYIYCHCLCNLQIFEHLPIYCHYTKLPQGAILCASKHWEIWTQTRSYRKETACTFLMATSSQEFDGHIFTRMFPRVRLELRKWACTIFQIQKKFLDLCIWCVSTGQQFPK